MDYIKDVTNNFFNFLKDDNPSLLSYMAVIFITFVIAFIISRISHSFEVKRIIKIHKEEIERLNKSHNDAQDSILKTNEVLRKSCEILTNKLSNSNNFSRK